MSWTEVRKLSIMHFFLSLFFLSPVAVFFYQQKGLNFFQILGLESIFVLAILIFEVPTGLFSDIFGRKKSIVLGTTLMVLESVIFLYATTYTHFIIAFAIGAIGFTFHSGTIEALIYDDLKKRGEGNLMGKSIGTFWSASTMGMIVAPIIGSYIAKDLLMSQFMQLITMSIGAGVIGIILSFTVKDTREKSVDEKNPIKLLKEGVHLLKTNKSLWHIVLLSLFSSPFLYSLIYLYQPYFLQSGIDPALFGTIFAVALVVSTLAQKYAYKFEKYFGVKKGVLIATLVPGIAYLAMAFVFHPIYAVILFVINRGMMGLKDPLFSHYKNSHIPSKHRATVLSLISMLVGLYLVGMRLILGKLADFGINYAFFLMGVIILISSIGLRMDESHITTNQENH